MSITFGVCELQSLKQSKYRMPRVTPNDILIPQGQRSSVSCDASPPHWNYITPTPVLKERGLTTTLLRQIIADINEQASADFKESWNPFCVCLAAVPCIGILVGFVLFVMAMQQMSAQGGSKPFAAMAVFGISAFGLMITCFMANRSYATAFDIAIDGMRTYVEETLNDDWQEYGIRWTVTTEQVLQNSYGHQK